MNRRGKLLFTIGLPRSGKSTWCQNWVRHPDLESHETAHFEVVMPRVIVSGDAFRLALHGLAYEALAEGMVFATMDITIRALLDSGHDVVVDETATTPETIKRYLRIDINAKPVWIETTLDECLRRAVETHQTYLLGPIHRMHAQMQKLKAEWPDNFEKLKAQVRARFDQDRMNTH